MEINAEKLAEQLQKQRRTVDFDTYDITLQQLLHMLDTDAIDIAPAYQRKFRWDDSRCSQLVESVFLGIPVPSLFMAQNKDSTWELVDGVQRISALVKYAGGGDLRKKLGVGEQLRLIGLEKLEAFSGAAFEDLPEAMRLQFLLRPIKVITLNDKSDRVLRFDLFERLNKGGVALTQQEIRDCVYRGRFAKLLEKLAHNPNFRTVLKLGGRKERDGTREECVLRFFAFLNNYKAFVHSVRDFLNDYMEAASKKFDYHENTAIFKETFLQLAAAFPDGLTRPTKDRKLSTTSLILYEAVAVGGALAIKKASRLDLSNVRGWIESERLRRYTTGATNDPTAVKTRIEFCRDRFLGKRDVSGDQT